MCHAHGCEAWEALTVGIMLKIKAEKECHDRCPVGTGWTVFAITHETPPGGIQGGKNILIKGSRHLVESTDQAKAGLFPTLSVNTGKFEGLKMVWRNSSHGLSVLSGVVFH